MSYEHKAKVSIRNVTIHTYTCGKCGHTWEEEFDIDDLTGWEPGEGDEAECPSCGELLEMDMPGCG